MAALLPAGCSFYTGSARDFMPAAFDEEEGWCAVRGVTFVPQRGRSDCGAAALTMLLGAWGIPPALEIPDEARAGDLRNEARRRGLKAYLIRGELADLDRELRKRRPVLVGLRKPVVGGAVAHYELVVAVHPVRRILVTLDPVFGWRQNSFEGFLEEWEAAGRVALVAWRDTNGGE